MGNNKVGYYFIVMASVVVVLAGVKSASEIIVPFLMSLFLAIILSPIFNFFRKKSIPDSLSLIFTISIFVVLIALVIKLIGSSIQDFSANIGFYEQKLSEYFISMSKLFDDIGIAIPVNDLNTLFSTKQIMSFTSLMLQKMGSLFTNGFVILLTVVFMLLESKHFSEKIAFADSGSKTIGHIDEIFVKIKEYMVLKASISILTGVIIWLSLVAIGVDYPFLWGVVAFLLNFIPNIGSIIAAVPAVLLALVQLGPLSALVVSALYVVINIVVGSVIEPKIMGKGLGLSTLVVFLSLLFWGWLLGAVGMLLSIPLTIMAKIVFDVNENTKWISVLLGTGEDKLNTSAK